MLLSKAERDVIRKSTLVESPTVRMVLDTCDELERERDAAEAVCEAIKARNDLANVSRTHADVHAAKERLDTAYEEWLAKRRKIKEARGSESN